MKKLFLTLLLLLGIPFVAFAQEDATVDSTDTVAVQYDEPFDIYVHEDCPHCQDVKAWIVENNLEDKVNLLELKNNDENMNSIESIWEEFEIDGGVAWPMMVVDVDTKEYALGSTPIIMKLAEIYGIEYDSGSDSTATTDETDSESGDKIFFILGGVLVLGIVGYVVYSLLSDEE